eukprot:GILK01010001.1.p1 GENE.GILK01010001.1~~GILK01010001.1.p1  ORF type:complete len:1416 (-),score=257.08 GILK01010001.1:44-4291(-)
METRYPQTDYKDFEFPGHSSVFCFPKGLKFSRTMLPPRFFTFVMTGGDGGRIYCACLVFYEPVPESTLEYLKTTYPNIHAGPFSSNTSKTVNAGSEVESTYDAIDTKPTNPVPVSSSVSTSSAGTNVPSQPSSNSHRSFFFAPHALLLLSHYPYMSAFKKILSEFYYLTHSPAVPAFAPIEEYVHMLTKSVPLPVPGGPRVRFHLVNTTIEVSAPPLDELPMLSFSLDSLVQVLSLENILILIRCLLTEKKVLLVSHHLSLLTTVAESLCALLYPFSWEHVYIPVLPSNMLDFIQAPLPFLVGVSEDFYAEVDALAGPSVVRVHIDTDQIILPGQEGDHFIGDSNRVSVMLDTGELWDLPPLPEPEGSELRHALWHLYCSDVACIDQSVSLRPQYPWNSFNAKITHQKDMSARLQVAWFSARLLHDYENYVSLLTDGVPLFNTTMFLDSRKGQDSSSFLTQFLNTQMFHAFLQRHKAADLSLFREFVGYAKRKRWDRPPTRELPFKFSTQESIHVPEVIPIALRKKSISDSTEITVTEEQLLALPDVFTYDRFPEFRTELFPPSPAEREHSDSNDSTQSLAHHHRRTSSAARLEPGLSGRSSSDSLFNSPESRRRRATSVSTPGSAHLLKKKANLDGSEKEKLYKVLDKIALEEQEDQAHEKGVVEEMLARYMRQIFLSQPLQPNELEQCSWVFKNQYARRFLVHLLNQPGVTEGPGRCLSNDSFESLVVLVNGALQEGHKADDLPTASEILRLSSFYYCSRAASKGAPMEREYLQTRIRHQPMWRKFDLWRYILKRTVQSKIGSSSGQGAGHPSHHEHSLTPGLAPVAISSKELESLIFGELGSLAWTMLSVGLDLEPTEKFVLDLAREKHLTAAHVEDLTVLVNNLANALLSEKGGRPGRARAGAGDVNASGTDSAPITAEDADTTVVAASGFETVEEANIAGIRVLPIDAILAFNPSPHHVPEHKPYVVVGHNLLPGAGLLKTTTSPALSPSPTPPLTTDTPLVLSSSGSRTPSSSFVGNSLSLIHPPSFKCTTLRGHTGSVLSMVSQQNIALSTGQDHTIRAWDVSRGVSVGIFTGHEDSVTIVKPYSKGGSSDTKFVSASLDKTIRLWDRKKKKPLIKTFTGHTGTVSCMEVDDYRGLLFSGSFDRSVRVWNISSAACQVHLKGHTSAVTCMSPPYSLSSIDKGSRSFFSSVSSIGDNMLISGARDGVCKVWDVLVGQELASLQGHTAQVVSCVRDGNLLVTTSADGSVRVWDLVSQKTVLHWSAHAGPITCSQLGLKTDGHSAGGWGSYLLLTGDFSGCIKSWDLRATPSSLGGGSLLSPAGCNQRVQQILKGHSDEITCLWADSRKLVSASADTFLRVWGSPSGRWAHLRALGGHLGGISSLLVDSHTLTTASWDSTLRIWYLPEGSR